MPRRRRRFADLEKQFRDSGGEAKPGSRLAGYIDFKKGVNQIKVTQRLTAAQRKRFGFAILPFNLSVPVSPTAADRYAAPITAYSNTGRIDLGMSNNECGYVEITGATQQADNFYPAILRCFVPTAGTTATTPVSAITKKEYRRIPGKNYTIPFGRTTTDVVDANTGATETSLDGVDEEDVRASLMLIAKTGTGSTKASSVSYEPEIFRIGKSDLVSPP